MITECTVAPKPTAIGTRLPSRSHVESREECEKRISYEAAALRLEHQQITALLAQENQELGDTLAGLERNKGSADGTGSAARFNQPWGVAVDSAGYVYVADSYNFTIRKITPTGAVTTLAGLAGVNGTGDGTGSNARFNELFGIAVDGMGNSYVSDYYTIRKITSAGTVTTLAGVAGSSGSADGAGSASTVW